MGKRAILDVLHARKSVLMIRNTNDLCRTRAICVTKAWLHKDENVDIWRNYCNIQQKDQVQTRMTRQLHEESGVPLGPCGHDALESFQAFLSPHYQLKVLSTSYLHMVTFQGPEAPLVIRLLLQDDPYHGCTLYAGFLERSHFCDQCNRGYKDENYRKHPCEGRRCPACKQKECGLKRGEPSPSLSCPSFHRNFYDETCLQ